MEPLEDRLLMAGGTGPRVTSIEADNRGEVVITFDSPLKLASITTNSVQVLMHSAHGDVAVPEILQYSTTKHQITIDSRVSVKKSYKIKLVSSLLKGDNGVSLDGEFTGAATPSGDGVAGGDFLVKTKAAAQTTARFTTVLGSMDVNLFTTQTPLTVKNFLSYANEGDWDGTFIHRSVGNVILQGGGYRLASDGSVKQLAEKPSVTNEPHPGAPGAVRGTIAMAKIGGQPNSATDEWFFNAADNRSFIDNQNGGFTMFGLVSDAAGLAVMDKIAAKGTVNLGGPFTELPVKNSAKANLTNPPKVNPKKDLILITRVAILVDVAAVG
jgi:cyclophilin family peptidyl-prolyl cis-trans isomerase